MPRSEATETDVAPPKDTIRVFLVDDHPLVRRGLTELIDGEPDMAVCGEADSAEQAIPRIIDAEPDLTIVDLRLPGMGGLELTKRLRQREPNAKVLVVSMHDDSDYAERALRAGAGGYVNKQEDPQRFVDAIRDVYAGRVSVSPEVAERVLQTLVGGELSAVVEAPIESLTDRELEVFGLIGRGQTPREIAERLHLSVKTVDAHRDHIRKKLGARNAADLIRHAVQWVLENG